MYVSEGIWWFAGVERRTLTWPQRHWPVVVVAMARCKDGYRDAFELM